MRFASMLAPLAVGSLITAFAAVAAEPREIDFKTEKVGNAIHWMPEKIEVTQGEKLKIVAKHDLEGGFDVHGFTIPELKIVSQVERHKPLVLDNVEVPKTLKPGEYKVGCQFHPGHAGSVLVVKAAK